MGRTGSHPRRAPRARRGRGTTGLRAALALAVAAAAVLTAAPPASAAGGTCDIKSEMLALILAADRYQSVTFAAIAPPRRLSLGEAVQARIDYEIQTSRLLLLCEARLDAPGSPEKRMLELARKWGHASTMLLEGAAPDAPAVKQGHEASLDLMRAARSYFDGGPGKP